MASEADPALQSLYRKFVSGCHILHHQRVLDAYGHLSVRHPKEPEIFIMSRFIAPGTISSEHDLIEYHVADAEPVDPKETKGYAERCIHSEIYKRYPDINSVIHSHSEAVVPYTMSGVPLRACYHMAGFLGTNTPIFDIAKYYLPGDKPDMLVRNIHLGGALASYFSSRSSPSAEHAVVLMRGHGLTVVAPSIEDCVLRAVYTQCNASIQTTALLTHAAHFGSSARNGVEGIGADGTMVYLTKEEADAAEGMTRWSAQRPWKLWVREVEAARLYVNSA